LRHICVVSPPVCLDVPDGPNVASTAYGKNYFHPALMEPRDLPFFNAVKITRQTSPNQALIDKRRSALGETTVCIRFADYSMSLGVLARTQKSV